MTTTWLCGSALQKRHQMPAYDTSLYNKYLMMNKKHRRHPTTNWTFCLAILYLFLPSVGSSRNKLRNNNHMIRERAWLHNNIQRSASREWSKSHSRFLSAILLIVVLAHSSLYSIYYRYYYSTSYLYFIIGRRHFSVFLLL